MDQVWEATRRMRKTRLDQLLVERGLAESRERAQRLIRAGLVVVGEQRADKPGLKVADAAPLRLKGDDCPYVSRGGLKLQGALHRFGMTDLAGWRALDIGASTGGFTDCMLQHGAAHVWALDTGRGQLHERLRRDGRVTSIEKANARHLEPSWIAGIEMDLVTVDISFISLRLVLKALTAVLKQEGVLLALVKPQFEAGQYEVGRGGVVRDREVHRRVLEEIIGFAREECYRIEGLCRSPLTGPAGNVEFFLKLGWGQRAGSNAGLNETQAQLEIEEVLDTAYT